MSEEMKSALEDMTIAQRTDKPIGGREDSAYPGDINIGGGFFEGHYPGNLAKVFESSYDEASKAFHDVDHAMNEFFKVNQNMVTTGVFPLGEGKVLALFTRFMSTEEVEGIQRFSSEIRAKLDAERTKKAAQLAEEAKRERDAALEQRRLAALGLKCEQNHPKNKDTE